MKAFASRRDRSREVLGLISLEGLVSERMALEALGLLRALPGDPPVRGLILRISSGGGSLGAAQAIAEGLRTVSEELRVPTVACVLDLALSAGFYLALSADRVVATPAASLGGVGAVLRTVSIGRALEAMGIDYEGVASGPMKDALFPGARLTDEQRAGLRAVVDDCHRQFAEHVAGRRPEGGAETATWLREGHIFTGDAALNAGLIDCTGGLFSAVSTCATLAGLTAPSLRVLADQNAQPSPIGLASLLESAARLFPK